MDAPQVEVIYVGFNCPSRNPWDITELGLSDVFLNAEESRRFRSLVADLESIRREDAPILIRSEREKIEQISDEEVADAMRYFGRDPGDLL